MKDCILTYFTDLVTEIITNIFSLCPVDLDLFKWRDYLGQYVLSGFSVCLISCKPLLTLSFLFVSRIREKLNTNLLKYCKQERRQLIRLILH